MRRTRPAMLGTELTCAQRGYHGRNGFYCTLRGCLADALKTQRPSTAPEPTCSRRARPAHTLTATAVSGADSPVGSRRGTRWSGPQAFFLTAAPSSFEGETVVLLWSTAECPSHTNCSPSTAVSEAASRAAAPTTHVGAAQAWCQPCGEARRCRPSSATSEPQGLLQVALPRSPSAAQKSR